MGGCRCSYRTCKSATKLNGDLHFFHYPVKHRDRCQQWIRNARRPEFFNLPDDQLRNKVICDLHFEQRFFTNILRKRLVHNAVPTIHACSDEELLNDGRTELREVYIVPANEEGTRFTVDTDINMQEQSDISTFSFRDGDLVPVYNEEEQQSDSEQAPPPPPPIKQRTTISIKEPDDDAYHCSAQPSKMFRDTFEVTFGGPSGVKRKISSPIMMGYSKRRVVAAFKKLKAENVYISEEEDSQSRLTLLRADSTESSSSADEPDEPEEPKPSTSAFSEKAIQVEQIMPKKKIISKEEQRITHAQMMKQINVLSRDVIFLKRRLNSIWSWRQTYSKTNIHMLRGRLPPSMIGAITLNLYKKTENFTNEEIEFLTKMYMISPEVYSQIFEKMGWNLPDPLIVQTMLNK